MDRWTSRGGKSQRRERVRGKKMQVREKIEKSRFILFFQGFAASEDRKVGSLKRRVRSHLARWEMKNCTLLWREAPVELKMYKAHRYRSASGSWGVEKVHAVAARSTFPNQNLQNVQNTSKHLSVGQLLEVEMSKKCTPLRREAHFQIKIYKTYKTHQNTSVSDNFWKLRCRKSARRCGTKHVSNWKCTKHTRFGALVEVEMSKKCTPLWREAHFQVKMLKTHHSQNTFGSWDVEKSARRCGAKHISTSKC